MSTQRISKDFNYAITLPTRFVLHGLYIAVKDYAVGF